MLAQQGYRNTVNRNSPIDVGSLEVENKPSHDMLAVRKDVLFQRATEISHDPRSDDADLVQTNRMRALEKRIKFPKRMNTNILSLKL